MNNSCELVIVFRKGSPVVSTAYRMLPSDSEMDRLDALIKLKYFGLASKRRYYLRFLRSPLLIPMYREVGGKWTVNTERVLEVLKDIQDASANE